MKHKTLLIPLLMLFATSAFAQIPQTMSYQGVLTDANGTAVADGPVNLTFKTLRCRHRRYHVVAGNTAS